MRHKWMSLLLCLGIFLGIGAGATAQSLSVEWEAWNAQITAYADSSQLDIAETQIIDVLDGSLQTGQRTYTQPVEIQDVFLAVNNGQPQPLAAGEGPGQYQVFEDGGDIIVEYQLPTPVEAGDRFVVQINYSVTSPSQGLVDWFIVPGDHAAPVNSSTVTINFPDGSAPDPSFVRMVESSGTVSVSGNSIIIQSQGVIPPNQAFGIQVPYGADVGTGGDSDAVSPAQPSQPAPTGGTGDGLSSLLPILCILGVLILFGGGNLLRGLLGGQPGGGFFPTGGTRRGSPFGGTRGTPPGSGRGFRESANQNRNLPRVSSDKRRGGGASFK